MSPLGRTAATGNRTGAKTGRAVTQSRDPGGKGCEQGRLGRHVVDVAAASIECEIQPATVLEQVAAGRRHRVDVENREALGEQRLAEGLRDEPAPDRLRRQRAASASTTSCRRGVRTSRRRRSPRMESAGRRRRRPRGSCRAGTSGSGRPGAAAPGSRPPGSDRYRTGSRSPRGGSDDLAAGSARAGSLRWRLRATAARSGRQRASLSGARRRLRTPVRPQRLVRRSLAAARGLPRGRTTTRRCRSLPSQRCGNGSRVSRSGAATIGGPSLNARMRSYRDLPAVLEACTPPRR